MSAPCDHVPSLLPTGDERRKQSLERTPKGKSFPFHIHERPILNHEKKTTIPTNQTHRSKRYLYPVQIHKMRSDLLHQPTHIVMNRDERTGGRMDGIILQNPEKPRAQHTHKRTCDRGMAGDDGMLTLPVSACMTMEDFLRPYLEGNDGNPPENPVQDLHLMYGKEKIGLSKKDYVFETVYHNGRSFFSCRFSCKLTNRTYYSSVPRFLLDQHDDGEGQDDRYARLRSAVKDLLDDVFVTTDEGRVFLSSTKGAKRAVALAVLQGDRDFLVCRKDPEWSQAGNGVGSVTETMEAATSTLSSSSTTTTTTKTKTKTTAAQPLSKSVTKKHARQYPKWVHQLEQAGIVHPEIQYVVEMDDDCLSMTPFQPCRVYCHLSAGGVTVRSLPCDNKPQAINDAIQQILQRLPRKDIPQGSSLQSIFQANPVYTIVRRPVARSRRRHRRRRPLACHRPQVEETRTAVDNIPQEKSSDRFYLYHLRFLLEDGRDLISTRMELHSACTTQIGVLFDQKLPISEESGTPPISTTFQMGDERVVVQIDPVIGIDGQTPRVVSLASSESRSLVATFNQHCLKWKSYAKRPHETFDDETRYLFVPLSSKTTTRNNNKAIREPVEPSCGVDWAMLRRIHNDEQVPIVEPRWRSIMTPMHGLCVVVVGVAILFRSVLENRCFLLTIESVLGVVLIVVATVLIVLDCTVPLQRNFTVNQLQNRFLMEMKNDLVTVTKFQRTRFSLTARSRLLSPARVADATEEERAAFERRYRLDKTTCTFQQFYGRRWGVSIRYPSEPLVRCQVVMKHDNHNLLHCTDDDEKRLGNVRNVVPELTRVFPFPRDCLYILQHADSFMHSVERAIAIRRAAIGILRDGHCDTDGLGSGNGHNGTILQRTEHVLDLATTPVSFERLEFLGDHVLAYFLTMNLVARNSSLQWDGNGLGDAFQDAAKNTSLIDGAFRLGVPAMLNLGRHVWKRVAGDDVADWNKSDEVGIEEEAHMADSFLCDSVEAVIAAVFLSDTSSGEVDVDVDGNQKRLSVGYGTGRKTANVIDQLHLPFPLPLNNHVRDNAKHQHFPVGFDCIDSGYPFLDDASWSTSLDTVADLLLSCPSYNTLCRNATKAASLIGSFPEFQRGYSRTLILAAICTDEGDLLSHHNDDDNDKDDTYINDGCTEPVPSDLLLHLCDTLAFVGNTALRLLVTKALYDRYPLADENDLHLLLACATDHDALLYVMAKRGFLDCFETDQPQDKINRDIKHFREWMAQADRIGLDQWNTTGGWYFGMTTFLERSSVAATDKNRQALDDDGLVGPSYPGIGGGRLLGYEAKKSKQAMKAGLVDMCKAIVGTVVLVMGMNDAWSSVLCPMWNELLLLDAEEVRLLFRESSTLVASSCKK